MGHPSTRDRRRSRLALPIFLLICLTLAATAEPAAWASNPSTQTTLYLPIVRNGSNAKIVFSYYLAGGDIQEIYTMSADGLEKNRLTTARTGEACIEPVWSPDGKKIAFTRESWVLNANGTNSLRAHIYVINADGSGEHKLVDLLSSMSPAWSPDGTKIAFQGFTSISTDGYDNIGNPAVFTVGADGSGLRQLTDPAVLGGAPFWSPDGRMIAVGRPFDGSSSKLWVMNADGTQQRSLNPDTYVSSMPSWSPDSSQLVYAGSSSSYAILQTQKVDGSPPTTLIQSTFVSFSPQWSPDGSKILFGSAVPDIWHWAIEVISPDGSGRTELSSSSSRPEHLHWSSDGTWISFDRFDKGIPNIFLINADGSGQILLSQGREASWRP